MVITSAVIALVVVVSTIVRAVIIVVMFRFAEIEVVVIIVPDVDSELPAASAYVDRTVEVIHCHEVPVLVGI